MFGEKRENIKWFWKKSIYQLFRAHRALNDCVKHDLAITLICIQASFVPVSVDFVVFVEYVI